MSQAALEKLKAKLKDGVLESHNFRGDETAVIKPAVLVEACRYLRDDPALKFDMLIDATAVDYLVYPGRSGPRFELVYHLYSTSFRHRLRLKVPLAEERAEVDSLWELWAIADWMEREIWDLYGIRFKGHPNLRRILLYDQFVGHPLRKDYPKDKRQPLIRRPENEIAEVLARRGKARPLLREGE